MHLSPSMEKYILHWGEMGTRWGVNRSVAQIHALLYLAGRPLTADEICESLTLARSNVSTSIRELQGWGLINTTSILGDRRDHFEAVDDLWTVLMTIVEERKKREVDPTLSMLRTCVLDAKEDDGTPKDVLDRMSNMLTFIDNLTKWYEKISRLPKGTLIKLMNLGNRVARFVGG